MKLVILILLAVAHALAAGPADALKQADEAFCRDYKARGADGWLAWFAEDSTIFPPGQPMIEGKPAIARFYRKAFSDPNYSLDWTPVKADIAKSGDLGYTIGTWVATVKKPGGTVSRIRGKYMTTWKKQPDGSWKVVADLGTPSEPAAKP